MDRTVVCGGVTDDSPPDLAWRGLGLPGRNPPLPPEDPNLPVIFTKTSGANPVPGIGVPGWSFKSDQTLGSICALPYAGQNCYPGGG